MGLVLKGLKVITLICIVHTFLFINAAAAVATNAIPASVAPNRRDPDAGMVASDNV